MSAISDLKMRRFMGRTAAILYTVGATVALLAVLLPHWKGMRSGPILILLSIAYAAVPPLLLWSARFPRAAFHAVPMAGALLITIALAFANNDAGAATFAALYVFPTLYSFMFFSWRKGLLHLGWVGMLYAITLLSMPSPAGPVKWIFAMGTCGAAGAVVAWLVQTRNLVENALRTRETEFRLLFASNPHPMWVYDSHTLAFVEVNDAAIEKYGWTREEFAEMRISDIRPPEDVPRLLDSLKRTSRSAFQLSTDWRHKLRDGTIIDVIISSHTLSFRGRSAVLVVAEDVTEQKQAERAMAQAYELEREAAERLRGLDEMKNSILEAVSHELRTPLTVVLGIAATMRDNRGRLPAAASDELVERLANNATRLERLLTGLLDLDRVTRGIIEAERDATDVLALARRVAGDSSLRNVTVRVDDGSTTAMVDAAKVERIVENLIVNADRHTPPGTTVWVRAKDGEDGLLLTVEDSGPGVPDPLKADIFEPFRRGDTPAHSPGTGIGLSLVSQFAKLHGGKAWVEDRPGGGASFKVLLPAA
jgi:hypothetical protein